MSNLLRRISPLVVGIGIVFGILVMSVHLSVVVAQPSPPVATVIANGSARAVIPPTVLGGEDLPGSIVGQVCLQDRVTIINRTRQDEATLWVRVQLMEQGQACDANRIPIGAIVFLDSQLIGQGTAPAVPPPAAPTAPPAAPTAPPAPDVPETNQPTPTLPPATFNNCQQDPNPNAAPDYPVKITSIDKVAEVVILENISGEVINLTDWTMCSITGNQTHDGIEGNLLPGERKRFGYTGSGNIWNNSDRDDGSLYNNRGQLVSYWEDR